MTPLRQGTFWSHSLRALLDLTPQPVLVVSRGLDCVVWNIAFKNLLGLTGVPSSSTQLDDVMLSADRDAFSRDLMRLPHAFVPPGLEIGRPPFATGEGTLVLQHVDGRLGIFPWQHGWLRIGEVEAHAITLGPGDPMVDNLTVSR